MKTVLPTVFFCLAISGCVVGGMGSPTAGRQVLSAGKMDNNRLGKILSSTVDDLEELEGREGFWRFKYKGIPMILLTDESHNRLRIISAIMDAKELSDDELRTLMEANFDRTMDARYAIFKGKLYSAFIHPLGNLSPEDFRSALAQVANLVINYGTNYSSSNLRFEGGGY